MTEVVGHFFVFTVAAIGFLLAPLLIGRLVRPRLPSLEKDATYECGEPSIGSSYIQFDLRFYVVALLFIIFDVEVVFFFPWATVFGNAMQLADPLLSSDARIQLSEQIFSVPPGSLTEQTAMSASTALRLGWTAFIDVAAFFGILLVGFAYVWKRGDLDWVRSTIEQRMKTGATPTPPQHTSTRKPAPATAG